MARINTHTTPENEKITEIEFSKNNSYIGESEINSMIRIYDEDGDYTLVEKKDIPHLIKALEKAQKIWT